MSSAAIVDPVDRQAALLARFSEKTVTFFGDYLGERCLNVGSARHLQPGFVNLDISDNVGADIVHDLRCVPYPFPDASFDTILGTHVFEHIEKEFLVPMVGELHRILAPGGYLIAVTPYATSNDAIDNPWHFQAFTETTWHFFDRRVYNDPTTAGYGAIGVDWSLPVVETRFVPYPDLANLPPEKLEFMKRHFRNVVQEIHVVMQKPQEAV